MNKLSAKRIYILLIAVLGIIAISIYSTYAIFTLEKSSDNIISIRTPETLQISSSTYEYKQVTISKHSYMTTDVDIYNNFGYELCYSIWYKAVGNNVKIYENTNDSLTTSGTIPPVTSKRISLIIINDNDNDVKVNIGVSYVKNEGTCELNISDDKALITSTINAKSLSETTIKQNQITNSQSGYLIYKDNTDELILSNDKTYYVANEFTYQDEVFTLKEPKELIISELPNFKDYYLCEGDYKCSILYNLVEVSNNITKYNMLIGYLGGENGLRKINNDYYYYGDNPHNFIYYNCTNELDPKTCELWRIIGLFYDSQTNKYLTKIIRNNYLDTNMFDSSINTWKNSSIAKYLNEEYKLTNENIITEYTFKEENLTSLDIDTNRIPLLEVENKARVTLLSISDYLNTSICQKRKVSEYDTACIKNNWLNKNTQELTMTTKYQEKYFDEETNEEIIPDNNMVYSVGNEITEININDKLNIRPVVYLKTRILLTDGDGSLDHPYVIR